MERKTVFRSMMQAFFHIICGRVCNRNLGYTVLVIGSLTQEQQEVLEAILEASVEVLSLEELARQGWRNALRVLRVRSGGGVVIAAEDGDRFGPLMACLAMLSPAQRRFRYCGGRVHVLTPLSFLSASIRLLWSLACGLCGLLLSGIELIYLSVVSRCRIEARSGDVLYINPTPWSGPVIGGAVSHTVGVIAGLVQAGWRVRTLSGLDHSMLPQAVRPLGFADGGDWAPPGELNLCRHSRRLNAIAVTAVHVEPPAMVYQRLTLGTWPGVAASRRAACPLILEYNGSEVWVARNWGNGLRFGWLAQLAERVCLRHAHLVVVVSLALADQLRERGVPSERIVVAPNGVDAGSILAVCSDTAGRATFRQRHDLSETDTVALFLGTFGRWHGAEVFAQAVAELAEQDPEWVSLRGLKAVFVGDGLTRPTCDSILSSVVASRIVRFTGLLPHDQALAWLAAADVLMLPHVPNGDGSPFIGSPTKLFEYMAAGRPIIASALDQIGDILKGSPEIATAIADASARPEQDACAVLVKPGSVDQLKMALRLVADRPEWARDLGESARQRAVRDHGWNVTVNRILAAAHHLGLVPSSDLQAE